MPTITFSLKDFQQLLGKKISENDLIEVLEYCKGEVKSITGDEVSVELKDTNFPYTWSVEGLARLCKGVLKLEKGIPRIKIHKSNYKIAVDKNLKLVRPFISAFVAKGKKIDEYLLRQFIQLQEKLADAFGRKRKQIAVGLYPAKKIKFPIAYKAVPPHSVRFVALDDKKERSLSEILREHPKGKEYAWILKEFSNYPVLIDSSNQVLSFPPVINSDRIGKLSVGDDEIFFEATGTDENAVLLVCNIFAYAFADRGFEVFDVGVSYGSRSVRSPSLFEEKIKISRELVKSTLGLDLKDSEIQDLLERARFSLTGNVVAIPSFRQDILHQNDVIEDICVFYGYNKIDSSDLSAYTIGSTFLLTNFVDNIRQLLVGAGCQEVFSAILSNKNDLWAKMNCKDVGAIEISEFMSESYSVVRTWILPNLIEVFSKNKHVEFPQKLFEQGLVTLRNGQNVVDHEKLAVALSHSSASFTELKQILVFLFSGFGISFSLEESDHSSFIPGRVAKILVRNKPVGFLGELHPQVLTNWRLEMPVVALELDLTDLFGLLK